MLGTDTVYSFITHALAANVESLLLIELGNLNGTGNGLANELIGNVGNNRLSGGKGADHLIGGAGHDIYVVDNANDIVTEKTNEGVDVVPFTLGDDVESLTLTGASAINGTGNMLKNTLTGNDADNILSGGRRSRQVTRRGW